MRVGKYYTYLPDGRQRARRGRLSEVSLSATDSECRWGAAEVSGMVLGADV